MSATDIAKAAMQGWMSKDAGSLTSLLSNDFVCRGFLPQAVDKLQFIGFANAIMTAIPDWSFNEHFLHEHPFAEQSQEVLFVTSITGTHTGDLILPDLPIIPATGTKIKFPNRNLEYTITGDTITTITGNFSRNVLEELLAQLGMVLP